MASISSLSSSSTSSIYGNRNVLSGLASGLDTESMIENSVKGYKLKLSSLQQQRTKVEWKQSAYRSIISKMASFTQKYTSYTSGTNLLSANFFNSATKVSAMGKYADKVSATGKTNSDVKINSVKSLATAARYSVDAGNLNPSNQAAESFKLTNKPEMGTLKGSMTIGYGGKDIRLSFSEDEVFNDIDEMVTAINEKLEKSSISFDNGGGQVKASERIKAEKSGDTIEFKLVKENDDNGVWISGTSGNVGEKLGIDIKDSDDKSVKSFKFDAAEVTDSSKTMADLIKEKGFTITVDGKSKSITWDEDETITKAADFIKDLQKKIDDAFGEGKLKVSDESPWTSIKLKFEAVEEGTTFEVTSTLGDKLGMEGGLTSYVNTNRTLKDVIGTETDWESWKADPVDVTGKTLNISADGKYYTDEKGNKYLKEGDGDDAKYYKANSDGEMLYKFSINGQDIEISQEDTLEDLMNAVNSNENAGVTMAYSKFTGKFTFTAKDTGAAGKVEFGGGLADAMFTGGTKEDGTDAVFSVTVNGEERNDYTHSSNTIDIDGMSITLKDTFNKDGTETDAAVTFSTSADADKIVDAVKSMVEDYNAMITEIKKAYSTMPLTNSKGKNYEPLTDEDQADMSESAIKSYEEKAKTGLLFADRDLSNLYTGLTNALNMLGVSGNDAQKLGITTSYSDGTTTLALDENALRESLASDPDKVAEIFTRSTKNGASTDGLMQSLKTQLDKYAATTGATKGLLVEKAGSSLAPTSIYSNTLQKQLDNFDKQISKWQDKLSDQIDYYNKKFTTLEKLVAQMNNQSSMLMGLSGGY